MKFLLSFLALLLALPAWAVTVSGSGGTAANRSRTVSWQNGDTGDSAAIPNQCAVWRGSFSGTSAAASVYALTSSSAAASTGTLLATFSTSAAAVTSFETAYPYIKVDVTDDPASGTASLYLYCAQEAGGGGAAQAPGIIGNYASDSTLEYLATLTNAEFMPSYPRVYFSALDANTNAACVTALGPSGRGGYAQGNDQTGNGSQALPYRSLGRALAATKSGHVIAVLDACDTWITDVAVGAGGNGDWMCRSTGANCAVAYELADSTGVKSMSWAGTDGGKCASQPEELCFAVIGSDPTGVYKPLIDFTTWTDPHGRFFSPGLGSTKGWGHFENLRIGTAANPYPQEEGTGVCDTSDIGDLFFPDDRGKITVLNLDVQMCSATARNGEFWTSHYAGVTDTNYTWSINSRITYPDIAGDQASPAYFNIGASSLGIIGGYVYGNAISAANGAGDDLCVKLSNGVGPNYGFVHLFDCKLNNDAVQQPVKGFECATGATEAASCRLFVSRTRVLNHGVGNGFFQFHTGGTAMKNITLIGYRNASIGNDAYVCGGQTAATCNANFVAGSELTVVDRCSVHYKGAVAGAESALFLDDGAGDASCSGFDLDIWDTGILESDTTVLRIKGTSYATSALAALAGTGSDCHGDTDWTRWDPVVLASNPYGNELNSGIVTLDAASQACNVGSVTESWSENGFGFYLPAYIAGKKLTGAIQNPTGVATALGR